MGLNIFSLLFGFSAFLSISIRSTYPATSSTNHQVIPQFWFSVLPFFFFYYYDACSNSDCAEMNVLPSSSLSPPFISSHQRVGSYVAKGSAIAFSVKCFLASLYVLLVSWRGLRRYTSPHNQAYSRLSQVNIVTEHKKDGLF